MILRSSRANGNRHSNLRSTNLADIKTPCSPSHQRGCIDRTFLTDMIHLPSYSPVDDISSLFLDSQLQRIRIVCSCIAAFAKLQSAECQKNTSKNTQYMRSIRASRALLPSLRRPVHKHSKDSPSRKVQKPRENPKSPKIILSMSLGYFCTLAVQTGTRIHCCNRQTSKSR